MILKTVAAYSFGFGASEHSPFHHPVCFYPWVYIILSLNLLSATPIAGGVCPSSPATQEAVVGCGLSQLGFSSSSSALLQTGWQQRPSPPKASTWVWRERQLQGWGLAILSPPPVIISVIFSQWSSLSLAYLGFVPLATGCYKSWSLNINCKDTNPHIQTTPW